MELAGYRSLGPVYGPLVAARFGRDWLPRMPARVSAAPLSGRTYRACRSISALRISRGSRGDGGDEIPVGGAGVEQGANPVVAEAGEAEGDAFDDLVILLAVRWYLRYGLSYRDLEELLADRGIEVDHVTLYRWVQRFTPLIIDAARPCRHAVGDRWFVDETYVKVAGTWRYVYRAIDQHGQVIDVLVSTKRNV